MRCHDKNETIRQYSKKKHMNNRISKIIYEKAKCQEKQLAYKKCKYIEIAEIKKYYQKLRYHKILKLKNNVKRGTKKIQSFKENNQN